MALSFPVTVVVGMEIRFVERDALYKGHVNIQVLAAFGAITRTYEFTGPSWATVAAAIADIITTVAAAHEAPALGESL